MIGIIFLAVLGGYVFLARLIMKRMPSRKARYIVAAIFILIPTWDMIPSWLYLEYLCKTEGGLKIYKTVDNVEGFYEEDYYYQKENVLKTYGYKYLESREIGTGKFIRYVLGENSQITKEEVNNPISNFEFIGRNINMRLPLTIYKDEYIIRDIRTKEILSMMKHFHSSGGWLKSWGSPVLGHGPSCPYGGGFEKLLLSTLKPINDN